MVTPINQTIQTSLTNAISPPILAKLSADNPIFVACSGGRDSMALLHLLYQQNLPIVALHVNHRIQAPSDDWEILVKNFCHAHNIPFLSKKLHFSQQKVSENHARQARYQAISELIQDFYSQNNSSKEVFTSQTLVSHIRGNDGKIFKLTSPLRRQGSSVLLRKSQVTQYVTFIKKYEKNFSPILALAHHANDQAETVLMNLCNGAGLHGLSAMREWALQNEFALPLTLWRPLLSVTREQISEYVSEHNLPYVDDPTNVTGDNQRALLRQTIMPLLAEQFKGFEKNIVRTSQNLAEASFILDEQAEFLLKNCQTPSWTIALQYLDITKLCQISQPQRFYILHFWLKRQMTFAPPRRFIEQIDQLIIRDNPDQQTILQWENQQIRRYRDRLYLLSKLYIALLNWANNSDTTPVKLLKNGKDFSVHLAQIQDFQFSLIIQNIQLTHLSDFQQDILQNLPFRQVKHGETFQRLHHAHHHSFKNICQSLAIPSWERALVRVMVANLTAENSQSNSQPIALIFPTQVLWLTGVTDFLTSAECEKIDIQMRFEPAC